MYVLYIKSHNKNNIMHKAKATRIERQKRIDKIEFRVWHKKTGLPASKSKKKSVRAIACFARQRERERELEGERV